MIRDSRAGFTHVGGQTRYRMALLPVVGELLLEQVVIAGHEEY